jgi:TnpA family transposase
MKNNNKRLFILSDLEEFAFYGFPDFTDEQRATYFTFEEQEWNIIATCPSFHAQVYCALQIGYFKAKKLFFPLNKIPQDDLLFILSRYFQSQALSITFPISKYEYYIQRKAICHLFGYKLWSHEFLPELHNRAKYSVQRDVSPNFIAHELLAFLQNEKIVRPKYSTLQKVISKILTDERSRLKVCLQQHLTKEQKQYFDHLLKNENTLSALAALKQDAKNFNAPMMKRERQKHAILQPLYDIAQEILPYLRISQQNITHYANLIHYYTIYDLDRFDAEQTYLYLLCYVFKRFQQINDNLVEAFTFQVKNLEKEVKATSLLEDTQTPIEQQIGRLLLLYVDETLSDIGDMRKRAFEILPKDVIRSLGEKMMRKPQRKQKALWQARDKAASRYKYHLRPLFMKIHFASQTPDNPLLTAIHWLQRIFAKRSPLSRQHHFPTAFISKRLSPYLFTLNEQGEKVVRVNRYEILVYAQIAKQMETGSIYVTNSTRYRPFSHDLVSLDEKATILKALDIPWLRAPRGKQLDLLFKELDTLWHDFNISLKQGSLKHLRYDPVKKELIGIKPKATKAEDPQKQTFYDKLPLSDISDVLRFINEQCGFLSAFTPLQPRYNKQKLDDDHLIATLISQGMNIGHYRMSQISDIPYHILESTYQQYLRLGTLRKAHDIIANAIMRLSIFPHYTFDDDTLYGALDGQKYEMLTPTLKARYSRKYYKKGRGVVAYTLLSNHVPVESEIIGPHEHESYFVFDIWYKNTSLIQPTVLTGDMHCVNKANFAILHWFGAELRPRFTNLKKEITTVSAPQDPSHYQKFLIQPAGQINRTLIEEEGDNIDRVIATLALKEISQSTLIKKLCSLSHRNRTRKAIFEFDKIIRSIYTLKCALDPKVLSDVHRSQNRIESYHTLRAAIAKVGGRKALLGKTDLEVEVSNQCGRIIASGIIHYNASIHSRVLDKNPSKKQLKVLKKSSPAAWRHLHFTGHFTFYTNKKNIDLDKIIEHLEF